MTDEERQKLCENLRGWEGEFGNGDFGKAANEIERLAAEIERLKKHICELELNLDFIASQDRPGGDE